mgnify:CR=1 FL=1
MTTTDGDKTTVLFSTNVSRRQEISRMPEGGHIPNPNPNPNLATFFGKRVKIWGSVPKSRASVIVAVSVMAARRHQK